MVDVQVKLLELLKDFDALCRKYNINYYLAGGTLVGAVRHGGFLPWDDDADIHMSRGDALRLLDAMKKENNPNRVVVINTPKNDYMSSHWRYEDTSSTCLVRGLIGSQCEQGQYIDIFVNYPLPKNEKKKERCLADFELYLEFKSQNTAVFSRDRTDEYAKRYARIKLLEKIIGRKAVLKLLERRMYNFPEEDAEEIFICSPAPPKRTTEKALWGTPRYVKFEDTQLPIPEFAERLLCYSYGPTWYEVPQQVERGEHTFVIDTDTPYQYYTAEYNKHLNLRQFYLKEVAKKEYWMRLLKDRNHVIPRLHALKGKQIFMEISRVVEHYGLDLQQMILDERKEELEMLFAPYFALYDKDAFRYWGIYVDMPDTYLHAAFYFSCFDGNYGFAKKQLKQRRAQDRPLSPELEELCEICDATDELLTALYGEHDYDRAEALAEEWLEKYPNLLYFMRAKLYLCIQKVPTYTPEELLELCETYLKKYEKDGELLKYKGDLLMMTGKKQEAELCYQMALNTLRNGYCITEIKAYFQQKEE